jgi:hypothetical protein
MPFDYGDDDEKGGINAMTSRNHDWPCLRQFTVFMENQVGRLHQLFKSLERHDMKIIALSVNDSVDFACIRLMVNDADRAREIFKLSDFAVFEKDMLGVLLPEDPQPMLRICLALMQAELNIHYTYPLIFQKNGKGAIALCVDDIDTATKVLRDKGHEIITEGDLHDDGFF